MIKKKKREREEKKECGRSGDGRAYSLCENCISDESRAVRTSINVAKYFLRNFNWNAAGYVIRLIGFDDGDPTLRVITRVLLK